MDELRQLVEAALGLGKQATDITMVEMALRAAVTFAVTLTIVRLGKKRLMSGDTAFDVIVGVIIGSTVSRGPHRQRAAGAHPRCSGRDRCDALAGVGAGAQMELVQSAC